MKTRAWISSSLLLLAVAGVGGGLAAWKSAGILKADAPPADQAEPAETIAVAAALDQDYRPTSTAIGTVLATRSVTLRNELPGTIAEVHLTPGRIVEKGDLLVALDVAVEQAELKAFEAQAALADTLHKRLIRLGPSGAASQNELDRARTERDVALAQIERIKAIIARKTLRAPFRARIGLSDLHAGQYLEEGRTLTTLQGIDDVVHVDFTVAQRVAAGLREGDSVEVITQPGAPPLSASVIAIDAKVDPATRNATVRARIAAGDDAPSPGASVRVRVPAGAPSRVVSIPVSALRKGPEGDHVYVIAADSSGKPRAKSQNVKSGPMVGDHVLIHQGLVRGQTVATTGSFKLRDQALVAIAEESSTATHAQLPGN